MEAWEAELLALGERIDEAAEEAAAEVLKTEIRRSVSAHQSPDGDPWPKREDGGSALDGAANKVVYEVSPGFVVAKIGAPEVFHNFGAGGSIESKSAAKGLKYREKRRKKLGTTNKFHSPKRQILPESITPRMERALIIAFQKRAK